MDIRKLQRAIVDGLEDVKGQHIVVFNTEQLSALFERVIIASGTSNRQTKALAASVRDAVKAKGFEVVSVEGEENGEWIIVDCGAAVVHLMQPSIREYYNLEEIWGAKPVKLKLESERRGLVKASEPEAASELRGQPGASARKASPRGRASAQPAAAEGGVKAKASRGASAEEPAPKPARQSAAKRAVGLDAPAQDAPPKKPAVPRKRAAKRATATETVLKVGAPKKTAAKKVTKTSTKTAARAPAKDAAKAAARPTRKADKV